MPARPDRLLTNRDLQARLRLSRTSIHFMVKRGEFPAPVQIGRARRWRDSDVNAWIAAQTAAGADGDSRPPAQAGEDAAQAPSCADGDNRAAPAA